MIDCKLQLKNRTYKKRQRYFLKKFQFENKKVRTADINPILDKIAQFNRVNQKNKKRDKSKKEDLSRCVPWVGIEPTLPRKLDFESSASTSSATKAIGGQNYKIKFTPH